MSKHNKNSGFGKMIVFAAVAGAVAAGISYLTKYKSFHKELEEDFHDFEDDTDISQIDSTMNRSYVALHADRDELKVAAADMGEAAKDMAGAAKNLLKDAAVIAADTAQSAAAAAADTAQSVLEAAKENFNSVKQTVEEKLNSSAEKEEHFPDRPENETTTIVEEEDGGPSL